MLPFLAKDKGKTLAIKANQKIINFLHKTGCIDTIEEIKEKETDIVPLLEKNAKKITCFDDIHKLVVQITNEAPVKMDEKLTALFTSKIGEMYNNSIEHSEAKSTLEAKYLKYQKGVYCFSCYDTGIGIPQKVINAHKSTSNIGAIEKSPTDAFKWAMQRGNSTEPPPRGLGLGLLTNFAKVNKGNIRICSGNVLYMFDEENGEKYFVLKTKFEGTLFEMDIITDNNHKYVLK